MNTPTLKNSHKWLALSAVTLVTTGAIAPSAEAANFTLDFDSNPNGDSVLMKKNNTLKTKQWEDWGLTNIVGYNNRTGERAKLNLYNTTTNAGGQDNDLRTGAAYGTAPQGNVLIIQEEDDDDSKSNDNTDYFNANGKYRADDEAWGGRIDFKFAESVAFNSFSLLDIDDDDRHNGKDAHKRIKVQGFDSNNNKILNIDVDELIEQHKAEYSITDEDSARAAQGTSFSMDGVKITQVSNRRNDNSMYKFEIQDKTLLSKVRFSYPGSGAISGLNWSTEDEPRDIPEPSAIGGLLMIGFVGSRKYLKRKQSASDLNA